MKSVKADFHSSKSERAGEKRNVDDVKRMRIGTMGTKTRRALAEKTTLVKVKTFWNLFVRSEKSANQNTEICDVYTEQSNSKHGG